MVHMSDGEAWRPTAPLATLRLRAELLAATRAFFAERSVLEVETPALVRHAVTDLHIHSARVDLPGHRAPLYLHSSPEYAMKRLLAAGSGDIFQIAHVFRGNETSRWHNPEFTLIEGYRCGYSMQIGICDEAPARRRQRRHLPDRARVPRQRNQPMAQSGVHADRVVSLRLFNAAAHDGGGAVDPGAAGAFGRGAGRVPALQRSLRARTSH